MGVTVDLRIAAEQSGGDAQGDILSGFENLIGSATAANRLIGDAGANALTGGSGDDTLWAAARRTPSWAGREPTSPTIPARPPASPST